MLLEVKPEGHRIIMIAIIYAVAISLCGGTTQFAIKALTDLTRSPLTPAWYMTGAVGVGGIAMALMHETAPVRQEPHAVTAYLLQPINPLDGEWASGRRISAKALGN